MTVDDGALALDFRRDPRACLFTVSGRLDGATAGRFAACLEEHLGEDVTAVVLDGTGLSAVSSAGLRELLGLAKRLAAHDTKAVIVGLGPSVSLALEIAGFEPLFHRAPDVEGGFRALERQAKGRSGLLDRLWKGR